jgi:hypothetical protein
MANAEFNKKKDLFTGRFDVKLRKKLVKYYTLEHSFVWY